MLQRPRVWYNKESRMIDVTTIIYDVTCKTDNIKNVIYSNLTVIEQEYGYSSDMWGDFPNHTTVSISDPDHLNSLVFMNFVCVDKNKQRIYEGDILKGQYSNQFWHGTVIGVINPGQYEGSHYITLSSGQIAKVDETFELIGNIYENPELLSGSVI